MYRYLVYAFDDAADADADVAPIAAAGIASLSMHDVYVYLL